MHSLTLYEQKQHGTPDFPAAYCYVDVGHPRYQMPFHWHKEWELLRILDGSFDLHIDDDEYRAKKGDVLLIRGGMLHGGTPVGCTYECLMFDLPGMFRNMDMVKKPLRPFYQEKVLPYQLFPADIQPEVGRIVDRALQTFRESEDSGTEGCPELETVGCISRLFAYILRERLYIPNPKPSKAEVRRIGRIKSVLEYIEQHYNESLSLETLSRVAGMNSRYFCRAFRSVTSYSPMDYVNFYRVERAAYLLDSSELPITAVALECGYVESSYFTKVFHRYKGSSPRQYRENSRG